MSTLTDYKQLQIVIPDPSSTGGLALNENFSTLADCIGPCNYSATADPTASDNQSTGYYAGSRWFNTTTSDEFVCISSTMSTAVWEKTTGGNTTPTLQQVTDAGNATTDDISVANLFLTTGDTLSVDNITDAGSGTITISASTAIANALDVGAGALVVASESSPAIDPIVDYGSNGDNGTIADGTMYVIVGPDGKNALTSDGSAFVQGSDSGFPTGSGAYSFCWVAYVDNSTARWIFLWGGTSNPGLKGFYTNNRSGNWVFEVNPGDGGVLYSGIDLAPGFHKGVYTYDGAGTQTLYTDPTVSTLGDVQTRTVSLSFSTTGTWFIGTNSIGGSWAEASIGEANLGQFSRVMTSSEIMAYGAAGTVPGDSINLWDFREQTLAASSVSMDGSLSVASGSLTVDSSGNLTTNNLSFNSGAVATMPVINSTVTVGAVAGQWGYDPNTNQAYYFNGAAWVAF